MAVQMVERAVFIASHAVEKLVCVSLLFRPKKDRIAFHTVSAAVFIAFHIVESVVEIALQIVLNVVFILVSVVVKKPLTGWRHKRRW